MNKRHGFTLIELLVVIAIIAILAAVLFPVMTSAKEKGKQAQCASNLKQLSMAVFRYVEDNSGYTPVCCTDGKTPDWAGCLTTISINPDTVKHVRRGGLWEWVRNEKVYACPSGPKDRQFHYSMNRFIGDEAWRGAAGVRKLDTETAGRASKIMLLIHEHEKQHNDGYCCWSTSDIWPADVHVSGTTLSYCDGHVKCAPKKQIEMEMAKGDWYGNSTYNH